MTIRAVLFDLDDTLLDTTGSQAARAHRIAERLQRELPAMDTNWFSRQALVLDPQTGLALGVKPLIAELGLADTVAGREAAEMWFFQGCLDLAACLPGGVEVIRVLSEHYLLGVVTNGLERRQRAKFESLGIHQHFSAFVTSEAAGYEKPSPRIFAPALSQMSVAPDEAVFVGDRLDTDILGAREAGMHAIWLDHRGRCPASSGLEPDITILDLAELSDAIASIEARTSPVRRSFTPTAPHAGWTAP